IPGGSQVLRGMDEKPSLVPPVRRPLQASRRPVRMTPPHASGPKEERPPRWTSDQDAWAGPANRVSPPSHPNLRDSTGRVMSASGMDAHSRYPFRTRRTPPDRAAEPGDAALASEPKGFHR